MRKLTLVLLGAASSLSAQGTPPRDTVATLPGVAVTATRVAADILKTPMAVTKITAADLRSTNGYGLEDALNRVPGVIAQSRYGTSDVRLIIRGFGARGAGDRSNSGTSRGVRILLDGFPETEPDGRTAFDNIDLGLANAVEVVRSQGSSLWGNAAGGVVNVFSMPTVTNPTYDVQPIFGSFGLQRFVVRSAAPIGSGTAWAQFSNSTFEGWRKHSDARRAVLNAGASGWVGNDTKLGVYLTAANNLMHIPGPLTQAQLDADPTQAHPDYLTRDERRYNRVGRLGVSLEHAIDPTTSVSGSFFVNPKYLQRSERGTYRDFTRYHFGGNITGHKTAKLMDKDHHWTGGIDETYQDGSIQFYTLSNGGRGTLSDNKGEGAQNFGLFAQDQFDINTRLSVLLGARYDRIAYHYRTFFNPTATIRAQSKDFDRVSPRLGLTWLFAGTRSVYANVSGGIEVPAGNETDQPPTGPLPGALLNPLLDAISSTTYEVGTKSLAMKLSGTPVTWSYDVALYDIEVDNEIIPYNGGRYYQTAAHARRRGLEVGLNAHTDKGIFGSAALSFNDHKYAEYVVDSSVINASNTKTSDLSGNQVMGVPKFLSNVEIGTEIPGYRTARVKLGIEHSGEYFANDFNTITVPSYTILNLTAELRDPIVAKNGWGLRGFVTVHNLSDKKYIGSAFLNPDNGAGGQPAVFEPGMPQSVIVSFSLGRVK